MWRSSNKRRHRTPEHLERHFDDLLRGPRKLAIAALPRWHHLTQLLESRDTSVRCSLRPELRVAFRGQGVIGRIDFDRVELLGVKTQPLFSASHGRLLPQRSSKRRVEGLRPAIAFSCSRYPSALISRSPQTLRGRPDPNRSRQVWSSSSGPRVPRFSICADRPSMFDNEHFIRSRSFSGTHTLLVSRATASPRNDPAVRPRRGKLWWPPKGACWNRGAYGD
jgi:hypothetical protein